MSRIILLTGASSAGKSSLARAVQGQLDEPFVILASDVFADSMLPARWDGTASKAWWPPQRERFYDGFHRSIAAMADAGNELIVDHLIESTLWRDAIRRYLVGHDVFLVGVHCGLEELEWRELSRDDRRVGEARTHLDVDRVHSFGPYDFEVDTTHGRVADHARLIVERFTRGVPWTALHS